MRRRTGANFRDDLGEFIMTMKQSEKSVVFVFIRVFQQP